MTALSEHFQLEEFGKPDPVPPDFVNIFIKLAQEILEPVRQFAGRPLTITSGYRTEAHNEAIHGVPDSEHVATEYICAADFTFDVATPTYLTVRNAFDWMRRNPDLPFHQVILEHAANGSTIIHVSINEEKQGIRQALEGATYNAEPYSPWPVAPMSTSTAGQENA